MLAEGFRGFHASQLSELLSKLIDQDQARGVIIVLDTLKKFVSLMDKAKVAAFNNLIRRFVMKGGTVIALAHTNKNRDPNGKPVFGGTSDLVDDADCAYILDVLDASEPDTKIVLFENIKRRGNNVPRVAYVYKNTPETSYTSLLASVDIMDDEDLRRSARAKALRQDAPLIDAVTSSIEAGIKQKMQLAEAVADQAGVPKRVALQVIERYNGDDPSLHRWRFTVKARGAKVYESLPAADSTAD